MDYFDKSFTITVDVILPPSLGAYDNVEFKDKDANTSFLIINLRKQGRRLDLTNTSVTVTFERPDNLTVELDLTSGVTILDAINGKIGVALNSQALGYSGKVIGEVLITYPTNKTITSKEFYFLVTSLIKQPTTTPVVVGSGGTTQVNGNATNLTYDSNGRIAQVQTLNGTSVLQTTIINYNSLGNVISVSDSVNGTSNITYDSNGNITSVTKG